MSATEVQGVDPSQNGREVANPAADGNAGEVQDGQPQQQQQQRPGGWAIFKTLLIRMAFIYVISSFFRRSPTPASGPDGKAVPSTSAINLYTKGLNFDMYVYLKENEHFQGYESDRFWLEEDLVYGDWTAGLNGDGSFEKSTKLKISEAVMNNGSIYMHTFIVRSGYSPNPADENYDKEYKIHQFKRLNKYKKKMFHTTVNLLTGKHRLF